MPERSAVTQPRACSPSIKTAQFQHPPVPQAAPGLAGPHADRGLPFRYDTQLLKSLGNRKGARKLLGLTVYFEVDQILFFRSVGRFIHCYGFQITGRLGASRHACTASNAAIGPGRAGDILCAKTATDTVAVTNRNLTILDHCHISLTSWAWEANSKRYCPQNSASASAPTSASSPAPMASRNCALGRQIQYQLINARHGHKIIGMFAIHIGPDTSPLLQQHHRPKQQILPAENPPRLKKLPHIVHDHVSRQRCFLNSASLKIT